MQEGQGRQPQVHFAEGGAQEWHAAKFISQRDVRKRGKDTITKFISQREEAKSAEDVKKEDKVHLTETYAPTGSFKCIVK